MLFEQQTDNPFRLEISFHKVIEVLEGIAASDVDYRAQYAKGLLKEVEKVPELRNGIQDPEIIRQHRGLIRNLLSDLFPTALSHNEIKAVTIPFLNISFNYTQRFQDILNNAGPDFDMEIRDFDAHQFYVLSCVLLLNAYYGYHFDAAKPIFYDIPDAQGFMRHYRILYNGDFLEIFPTENAIELTPEDIELLLDNFDDLDLWKSKIPPQSWILRGFGIMSLFDATTESAVSNLKTNLLSAAGHKSKKEVQRNFENIFRSIFRMTDLEVGFTSFDKDTYTLAVSPFEGIRSYLLPEAIGIDCHDLACEESFDRMIQGTGYLNVTDVERFLAENPDSAIARHLLDLGIRSAIFAPVTDAEGDVLGIMELVSTKVRGLNSINSRKLDVVMPYISDTINRFFSDIQNQIGALIQKEYTTIHPSVYWKFRNEAYLHLHDTEALHEIVFEEVYPLYGQVDIKGSSELRNKTTREDLSLQAGTLLSILKLMFAEKPLPAYEQRIFELETALGELDANLMADTEQTIHRYIRQDVHPLLKKSAGFPVKVQDDIRDYFILLDKSSETVYKARKKYDTAVSIINKQLASVLDEKQSAAQSAYPHYYERFKTDGVEHNLYIGKSITGQADFDPIYLYNLRLWQLQVMCEMERHFGAFRNTLPYPMEVASLILVFNQPITIRFRMDEKRFDVDGSYNARYEIVKKRIDKAYVRGTEERITQPGRITIVYAQQSEEQEYGRYIAFLQHKGLLSDKVEKFNVEDLQGVSGLRAIRVEPLADHAGKRLFSYEDLLKELG